MKLQIAGFQITHTQDGRPPSPDAVWVEAVLGGVHESLMSAGAIAHPYFGDNEHAAAWMERATWWYRTRFALPGQPEPTCRAVLSFACLDTVADLWLNDEPLGTVRNQHRPHDFDVTGLLRTDNDLLLRFPPPLDGLLAPAEEEAAAAAVRARREALRPGAAEQSLDDLLLPPRRSRLRKATFSWGWDFAARVPSLGVAGAVTLTMGTSPLLEAVHVRTARLDLSARTATLSVSGAVRHAPDAGGEVSVRVRRPDGATVTAETRATTTFGVEIDLSDVAVWWTHDLGDQPLYEVEVSLRVAAEQAHTRTLRIGVRTIELDRGTDPAEDARHFRFVLNGSPVFARGANWVPASLLVGSVPSTTTARLVGLAREAGMTMLRVWGGGVYEPDAFYDACDESGILVWQDFMFACFDYPDPDGGLAQETRQEAVHQVTRLRNHACLALWCGNNEVQAIHELTQGSVEPGGWGWSLFHELLPAVVEEHDPVTPYWPGSPWGELPTELVNGVHDGDRHAWEVWHGIDLGAGGPTTFASRGEAVHFRRYDDDAGRFISEFGIHACPELATLQRWCPPGSLALGSAALSQRNKDTPADKALALMEFETGLPTSLADYVDFSMACQAEGLKHGVEHYRRRQPHCNGTLVWQFNDSWPGMSWSVIDYDLVPKAGYYFLQRAYTPLLASFRTGPEGLQLWVTSSGARAAEVDLVVEVARFNGQVTERHELTVPVGAYSSRPVWDRATVPGPGELAWVSSPSGALPANRRFFGPLRQLPLEPGPAVEADVTWQAGGRATVELRARAYSYLTRVMSSTPGVRFSGNYLDLRAGDTRTVEVAGLNAGTRLTVASYREPGVELPGRH
ncbi:MAG: glycoside hydrolase family 2 protein [Actinomycetota bacterium]|nr:glycoside hydrolase family 2 protein [Actinomycetota bacterium]